MPGKYMEYCEWAEAVRLGPTCAAAASCTLIAYTSYGDGVIGGLLLEGGYWGSAAGCAGHSTASLCWFMRAAVSYDACVACICA